MSKVLTVIRSVAYALLFYAGTIVFCILGLGAALFGNAATRKIVLIWSRCVRWATRHVLGIRVEVEGKIPPGPVLIAVKHQSMFETIEMVHIADTPVIVLKREIANLPLFGWLTRCYGIIAVDRDAGAKALREMLALGKKAKDSGRSILIYPEGTRVRPDDTPELRPGFAGMYRALRLPVVPIALNSGLLWGRGLIKQSGVVRYVIGETIPAGLERDDIERRVHAAINILEN